SGARTEHCFRRDLISQPKPRSESPRIVMRQVAIAMARTVAFERHRPEQIACAWIRRARGEVRNTAVLFLQISLEIVTQPVFQRELPRHFEAVLDEPRESVSAQAGFRRHPDETVIHAAQKE